MESMRRAGSSKARSTIARNYYKQGSYADNYATWTSNARNKAVGLIKTEASFQSTAERSFMRRTAAIRVGRFAAAANMAFFLAPMLFAATYHGFKGIKRAGYELETPNFGGHFSVSGIQATERQRTMAAMHNSELSARSALGNEAQLFHT